MLKSAGLPGLNILHKVKGALIFLAIIWLGILLGYLYNSSAETVQLISSIIVILILLLIIMDKLLNGLLVWIILAPFLEVPVKVALGEGIPDMSFSRFAIAFLLIFMLAHAAIGKFRFVTHPITLTEICIIAATIGIGSSAFMDPIPYKSLQLTLARHFTPMIVYFFARNLVQNKDDLNKLLWAVMISGLLISLYAVYETSTHHILFVGEREDNDLRTDLYGENFYLIRGLLDRAGNFGRVLTSTIPITFYLVFESKRIRQKIFLIGVLIIQAYVMFLTYNRTSWYALMIVLFILQFFYPQFRKVYLVLLFVSVVVLWATWDQVNQSAVVEERINSENADTYGGREPRAEAGFNMWKVKPIRGWGFEAYMKESGRFRTDGFHTNFRAIENDLLFIMVSSGLIGFIPYIAFLAAPLFMSLRLFFKARAPDWSGFIKAETVAVYWCILLAFVITSYTQVQNQPIVKMLPFAVAGAVVGTHQHWLRSLKEKEPATLELKPAVSTAEAIQ